MQEHRDGKVTAVVTFMDGKMCAFRFTPRSDVINQAARLDSILSAPNLIVDLDDRMVVIPMQNVRSVEFSPPPAKLPDRVLRMAEVTSQLAA